VYSCKRYNLRIYRMQIRIRGVESRTVQEGLHAILAQCQAHREDARVRYCLLGTDVDHLLTLGSLWVTVGHGMYTLWPP